jgi:hypothetical protein
MARVSIISCVLLVAILQAQESVPIGGRSRRPTSAVIDSSEIRKLITEEENRRREDPFFPKSGKHMEYLISHPDQALPSHKDFIRAMAKASAITVPGTTHAGVLEISSARCLADGISTVTFVRFVLTGKKPPGGTEVWVCTYPYAFETP